MTEIHNPTDVQIRARSLRAQFALPEETWRTNASANPKYPNESVEEVEQRVRDACPDLDLRFDREHLVDGYARLFTSDGFNRALGYEEGTVHFAVYGKPKQP